jgi:hypothetical protein
MESDNKILIRKPDGYKWLVMCINKEKIERVIYSDLTDVCEIIGISKSTIQRRLKVSNSIEENGFQIIKIPYFKSNRGSNIDNKEDLEKEKRKLIYYIDNYWGKENVKVNGSDDIKK